MLVVIVAAHRFSIAYPLELSADESELLVQIERHDHDIVPWRSVDGSTIGPVNPWFLMVVRGTGWPMTYAGLHLLATILQAMIVIVSYAVGATVPVVSRTAWSGSLGRNHRRGRQCFDQLHVLRDRAGARRGAKRGGTGILSAHPVRQPTSLCLAGSPWRPCSQGLHLGQSSKPRPICRRDLWLGALAVCGRGETASARRYGVAALVAATAVAPTVAIVALVYWGDALADLWASYFVANLGYAGGSSSSTIWTRLGQLVALSQLSGLMAAIAALGLYCLITIKSVEGRGAGQT